MTNKDDKDEFLYAPEAVLLTMYVLTAPPVVTNHVLSTVSHRVSIAAAEHLTKFVTAARAAFANVDEFLKEVDGKLEPGFRGEKSSAAPPSLTAVILGAVVDAEEKSRKTQFAEPTPGCDCERCTRLVELARKGIRIDANTGEEVVVTVN